MTGRGIDQIMAHPCDPRLHEPYVQSALDYVRLAEQANGPIPGPVAPSYIWGDALEAGRRAAPDVRVGNFETSVTRSDAWLPKGINYRMSPQNAECLRAAGFDCCTLANNHVLDWGPDGLVDTLETLKRLGIRTAGAGRDQTEAAAPAILDVQGKGRVLVFAYACADSGVPHGWAAAAGRPGVNLIGLSSADADAAAAWIGRHRRPGDVVVVSIHWGANWGYAVSDARRRFAQALIDRAGASIVHGHSSHHPLGTEVHRSRLILYGCGDFINDYEGIGGNTQFRPDLSLMYFPAVDPETGELVGLEMTPLRIRRLRLNAASRADAAWLATTLDRESARFGARVEQAGDGLRLAWKRTVH